MVVAGLILESRRLFDQRLHRRVLEHRIESGVDAVAALHHRNAGPDRLNSHDVHEPRRIRRHSRVRRRRQLARPRRGSLLAGDVALIRHQRQHDVAALPHPIRVFERVVEGRAFGHRRQRRGLRQCDLRRTLAEIMARRALDPVPAAPERNLVQVRLEDLVLGVVLLHLARRRLLPDFPAEAAVRAVDDVGMHVPDQLLCDGAGPATLAEDVVLERARDSDDVDAVVLIETVILYGDECVGEILG